MFGPISSGGGVHAEHRVHQATLETVGVFLLRVRVSLYISLG
jgi:hypothetical protein